MPHTLDAVERLELAGGPVLVEQAIDELDCLDQLARRFSGPHFAIAAGANPLRELVARDRFIRRFRGGYGCGHGRGAEGGELDFAAEAQPRHPEVWHTLCATRRTSLNRFPGLHDQQNRRSRTTRGRYYPTLPCFSRSITAAATITSPKTTFCGSLLIPIRFMPFWTTAIRSAPSSVPNIRP